MPLLSSSLLYCIIRHEALIPYYLSHHNIGVENKGRTRRRRRRSIYNSVDAAAATFDSDHGCRVIFFVPTAAQRHAHTSHDRQLSLKGAAVAVAFTGERRGRVGKWRGGGSCGNYIGRILNVEMRALLDALFLKQLPSWWVVVGGAGEWGRGGVEWGGMFCSLFRQNPTQMRCRYLFSLVDVRGST